MLFNSLHFAAFLPIVFSFYWICPSKYRWALLLVSSYYFYMSWNAKYVFLILMTTFISYLAALLMSKTDSTAKRKWIVAGTLIVCLGTLFVFKYLNFFFDSVTALFSMFSIQLHPMTSKLLLPVGISFYTFQTLSYVIDVYRGKLKAEPHFGIYATYVSFFPQLVAGPIERSTDLLPEIKSEHQFDYEQGTYGLKLMAWGFFKKIVIADNLAYYVDLVYNNLHSYSGFALVLATLFFAIQIYCDFSGYSDIAKGVANLFGIKLSQNFKSPYFSCSIKEFWSRWHISLSSWFKDYLYIPMGGNRCSKLRHSFNLMITFLVSGAWHGASWTYIIWGAMHGALQILENIFRIQPKQNLSNAGRVLRMVCTFSLVTAAWVFFRAQSFHEALYVFAHALDGIKSPLGYLIAGLGSMNLSFELLIRFVLFVALLMIFDYFSLKTDVIEWVSVQKIWVRYPIYFILVSLVLFFHAVGEVSFVYFQF